MSDKDIITEKLKNYFDDDLDISMVEAKNLSDWCIQEEKTTQVRWSRISAVFERERGFQNQTLQQFLKYTTVFKSLN